MSRRLGFPVVAILYVWFRRAEAASEPRPLNAGRKERTSGCSPRSSCSRCGHRLCHLGESLLPPYYVSRATLIHSHAVAYESAMFLLYAVAAAVLFRSRSSMLDLWLQVAFGFWLIQSPLIMTSHGRFTIDFYWLQSMMLVSHLVVMLALIAESNRLQAQLVLATSARDREREARLTSLDALAAVIAHEVGQPLTAVGLHARVGLNRLTRARPDVEMAIAAQRDTLEACRRTLDILKSIRSMFARQPAPPAEFDLNELVAATTALMAQGTGRPEGFAAAGARREAAADPRQRGPDPAGVGQPAHQRGRIPGRDT